MEKKVIYLFLLINLLCGVKLIAQHIELKISKKYLNIPVSGSADRGRMQIVEGNNVIRAFDIRLSAENIDYWISSDVSALKGKTVQISYDKDEIALQKIYQSDDYIGEDSLYREKYRPQIHFFTKRGWINDPNGLIYHQGLYHLYYQYNPYENEWGNMHWGHAVSEDLIHWTEWPIALYPDQLGTMFSGSAVTDHHNSAGFNTKDRKALIVFYTADNADREIQCMAYSLDNGLTFTKFEGNPIIDSHDKWNTRDTRDPKVFWYEPSSKWVMVLFERDGHSIYTSSDLKKWDYQSHISGFWECPELFELAVDDDVNNKKWVMYGASGTYMIGSFDGKQFVPESGKHYYTSGAIYAAQNINDVPDGRIIQIGWGRISNNGSAFNGLMLMPTELTLRKTKNGIRLFSKPVKELSKNQKTEGEWDRLSVRQAEDILNKYRDTDALRIQFTLSMSHAHDAGLRLHGQGLLDYNLNFNTLNGMFYSPENMTSLDIRVDMIIDKSSVEVFVDHGAYSYALERRYDHTDQNGYRFYGKDISIEDMKVYSIKSIWK